MYAIPEDTRFGEGEPLVFRLQDEWDVFNDDMNEDTQVSLLEEIVNADWDDDSGEWPVNGRDSYVVGGTFHTSYTDAWDEFSDKVRTTPDEPLPFHEYFEENLALAASDIPSGTAFSRARRGCMVGEFGGYVPYSGESIGAPPAAKVDRAGRANAKHQSVLYCANHDATAIAECRPARGFLISVCEVRLLPAVRILDLCAEPDPLNPFTSDSLLYDLEVREVLRAFAQEMSRPLERDDDEAHYIPSQRLSAFIRDAGYAGIRYPSALDESGSNFVFFSPTICEIGASKLYRITSTTLGYEREEAEEEMQERMRTQWARRRDHDEE